MPCDQFLSAKPTPAGKRPELGNFDAIPSDVVCLTSLYSIHNCCGVIPELALRNGLHEKSVGPCSLWRYISADGRQVRGRRAQFLAPGGPGARLGPRPACL